ncbi:MAG: TonB-dependent receptor [Gammaproteobacteria bacterium]|nr:TonB-dependent receptor [Gammaproteobacteria bacterium]
MFKLIKRSTFLSLLFITTFTVPLLSENIEDLDNLVVTATKTSISEDNVTAPITILSSEDIALSGATNLAELLRFVSGIDISMNGGPGQLTSLFVQGSNSNHVLILLNGVAINDSATGIAAIQNINPDLIDRIEIVKAPRTSLYGSHAIGGVINIFTKQDNGNSLQTSLTTGSDYMKNINLMTSRNKGKLTSGLQWSHYQTDGFPAKADSKIDNGYSNNSLHGYFQINDSHRTIKTTIWRTSGTTEYMDFFLSPISQDFENLVSAININNQINGFWSSTISLNLNEDKIDQNNSFDFNYSKKLSLEWKNSFHWNPSNELILGYIREEEDFHSSNYGLAVDTNLSSDAVYLENLTSLDKHQLLMAMRLNNKEVIQDQATWNFEYSYKVNTNIKLTANLGKAMRDPSNFDLYGFGGNPTLIPEISNSKSFGIQYSPDKINRIELRYYENRINELIAFNYSDYKLYNIEEALIQGFDLQFSTLIMEWEINFNAILQEADNLTNQSRLLRRPKSSIGIGLRRSFGKLDLNINMSKNSSRIDFGDIKLHPYFIGNIIFRYRMNDRLSFKVALNNFTDEKYTLANGYKTATRKAFIGLTYKPSL